MEVGKVIKIRENPLPAQAKTITPSLPSTVCGGGGLLPLPFPVCDLVHVHCAVHLLFSVQMNSCLPEQLLPK